MLNWVGPMNAV